jgi:hypothetical protein
VLHAFVVEAGGLERVVGHLHRHDLAVEIEMGCGSTRVLRNLDPKAGIEEEI